MNIESYQTLLKCTAVCSVFLPTMYICEAEFDLDVIEAPQEYAFRVGELKNLLQYRKEDSMTRLHSMYMHLCQETEISSVFFCDQCLAFVRQMDVMNCVA